VSLAGKHILLAAANPFITGTTLDVDGDVHLAR